MIHLRPEYKQRWFSLMDEGYLVSKPFYRNRIHFLRIKTGGRRKKLDYKDIPPDPRVFEPYVMRTYYFLDSLSAIELTKPRLAIDEEGRSGLT